MIISRQSRILKKAKKSNIRMKSIISDDSSIDRLICVKTSTKKEWKKDLRLRWLPCKSKIWRIRGRFFSRDAPATESSKLSPETTNAKILGRVITKLGRPRKWWLPSAAKWNLMISRLMIMILQHEISEPEKSNNVSSKTTNPKSTTASNSKKLNQKTTLQ